MRSAKTEGNPAVVCLLAGILMVLLLPGSLMCEEDAIAPDFKLANLEGEDVALSELLAGGPVILDFWATWCKPCIRGFPGLQALMTKYEDRGLTVVAVSVDGPKSRARVAPFIRSKKYSFEVLLDTQGRVAKKYNAMSIPRTVLISPEGRIAYATVGYRPSNHEQIEQSLIPLLSRIATEVGEVVE